MTLRPATHDVLPRPAAVALTLRFVIAVAVFGMGVGALLMLWEGILESLGALRATALAHDGASASVITDVMDATDKFLFGIVLVIFALTITFAFLIDLPPATRRRLPRWVAGGGLAEIKHVFFEVILVYLAVDFATEVVAAEGPAQWTELVKPVSILMLAGAMRLLVGESRATEGKPDGHGR